MGHLTPKEESAKRFLRGEFSRVARAQFEPGLDWKCLSRQHRLWRFTDAGYISHVCRPVLIHQWLQRPDQHRAALPRNGSPWVGVLQDCSSWHTKELKYRCNACKKVFKDEVAFMVNMLIGEGQDLVS
jgi:hypothetical protein